VIVCGRPEPFVTMEKMTANSAFQTRRVLVGLAAALALLVGCLVATAPAGARIGTTNPLAARPWGVYTGPADGVYPAWEGAAGTNKALLGKVALRPRVRWFGGWIPRSEIRAKVHDYVVKTQTEADNPNVLIHMAEFRLWPHGGEAGRNIPLTQGDRDAYKAWIDAMARGIGSARTAMVVEPDLAVAFNGWRPSVRFALAKYAAHVFSALPRTSVYIDGAASDWLTVSKAAGMLRAAGIGFGRVRGFALNATHYTSTSSNVQHGRAIAAKLARMGYPGKHFVVNTADTGRPFTWAYYWQHHPNGNFDNAETCQTRSQLHCVTLGIPPTSDVAAPAWHFSDKVDTMARRFCDAFLWYGRPWLTNQASPFNLYRTLQIARTTPY
jgi:endoglucanase